MMTRVLITPKAFTINGRGIKISARMFRVLLCIPPDYDYNFAPLGTPALCAFLKEKEIDCRQVDLNLEYRKFLVERINAPSLSDREKERLLKPVLVKIFKRCLTSAKFGQGLISPKLWFPITKPR